MDRKSAVLAVQHLEVVTRLLQCSGLIINTKMSLSQELEFLGMLVNTNALLVSLPADRVKEIMAEAIRISNMVSFSAHLLSHFLGKLSTATLQPHYSFIACRETLNNSNQDYEVPLSLSQPTQEKLYWWREDLFKWNGKPLKDKSDQVTISSDASLLGWERPQAVLGKFRNRLCTSTVWSF